MKILLKILPIAFICLGLSSCLKDELYTGNTNESPSLVEFKAGPNISPDAEFLYPTYKQSFNFVDQVDYPITINYAGGKTAPADIVVDVQVDAAALNRYNDQIVAYARAGAIAIGGDPDEAEDNAQSKLFVQAPTSFYTIPTNSVTIKKGERSVNFIVKVKPGLIDFNNRYAIPLTIKSASGSNVSGNFMTGIFGIVTKNDYDGVYELTGTMVDNFNATLTGHYPKGYTVELRTVDAKTVAYYDHINYHNYGHIIKTATGLSVYGSFAPMFRIEGGRVTEVTNYYGQPSSNGRSGKLDISGINTYTVSGDTKILEVKYIMVQGGIDRTIFTETFKYKGPRP